MLRLDALPNAQQGRLILGVLALGLGLAPRVASAADRYVVVESPLFQVRAAERDRLTNSIQAGLRAAGCEVASETVRTEKCTSAACWKRLAASNKVTDILVVTGGYQELGWQMFFEHRDGETGAKVGSEKENCDACPFDAMVERARATAQHMAETDRRESGAPVVAQPEPSPPPTATPAPTIPPEPIKTEPDTHLVTAQPEASAPEGHPIWPIFLMAGGGSVLAGGIVLVAINGHDTDCSQDSCLRRYKTLTPGLVLGGVGLAAVAVGIWQYVAWQPAGPSVSVRVGPGSLTLAGGF
jgi:hypothetical protein